MSCGAVYVLLGEIPEQDRLERCTRLACSEHASQLEWVDASFPRQVAYRRQVARYRKLTSTEVAAEQPSLLTVTGEA